VAEGRVDVGIAQAGQALARRLAGGDRGETLLGVAVVAGDVGGGQALQQGAMRRVEVAQGDEMVGQGPGLVPGPGVKGGDQRRLVDQAGLKGQQAEQEVSRRVIPSFHSDVPRRRPGAARMTGIPKIGARAMLIEPRRSSHRIARRRARTASHRARLSRITAMVIRSHRDGAEDPG
jgi:hypothetical protein